jgi:hypothetical protein
VTVDEPLGLQLLALAGKLTKAELSLTEHGRKLDELGGVGARLDRWTGEVAQILTELGTKVADLEGKDAAPTPDRLWDWTSMDKAKASKAWKQLREWVETVLVPWYDRVGDDQDLPKEIGGGERRPRRRIPPCWAWHRDVVIELSWLCQDWMTLYRLQAGNPARAGDWHSRYLPGVLLRIRNTSTAAGCTRKHTVLPGAADAASEPVGPDGDVDRAIALDLATRPDPPPPQDAKPEVPA